jgi:SAM-dependent methyltransferase
MGIPGNLDRFSGFAAVYDAYRPTPPAALIDLLTQLAGIDRQAGDNSQNTDSNPRSAGSSPRQADPTPRPNLVVDIGSGTGLSTLIWADRAAQVIGIEPNADMRRQAKLRSAGMRTITYRAADSTATGLPDGCADIVTCSQALHWLEPEPTFAEVARILRPGGVFAAYDCDWPPTIHWEAELAYDRLMERGARLEREHGLHERVRRWEKSAHLGRMRASGQFRYVRETLLHHVEPGNAERLVGLAISQGSIAALLRHSLSEAEIGIDVLRAEAARVLGSEPRPWYWSYRVRVGVR